MLYIMTGMSENVVEDVGLYIDSKYTYTQLGCSKCACMQSGHLLLWCTFVKKVWTVSFVARYASM